MGTSKSYKIAVYIFLIAIVLLFVFNAQDDTASWVSIARYICLGVIALGVIIFGIFYFSVFFENKKISKLLDKDDYVTLKEFAILKKSKKGFIINERKSYYDYLLLMAVIGLDDLDEMAIRFKEFNNYSMFPVALYWKTCYEFSLDNYENIDENYSKFINNFQVKKSQNQFSNQMNMFSMFLSFSKGNIAKAKETINKLNMNHISMKISLRSIEKVKNAEINEEN